MNCLPCSGRCPQSPCVDRSTLAIPAKKSIFTSRRVRIDGSRRSVRRSPHGAVRAPRKHRGRKTMGRNKLWLTTSAAVLLWAGAAQAQEPAPRQTDDQQAASVSDVVVTARTPDHQPAGDRGRRDRPVRRQPGRPGRLFAGTTPVRGPVHDGPELRPRQLFQRSRHRQVGAHHRHRRGGDHLSRRRSGLPRLFSRLNHTTTSAASNSCGGPQGTFAGTKRHGRCGFHHLAQSRLHERERLCDGPGRQLRQSQVPGRP